jgi:hypothetical protein
MAIWMTDATITLVNENGDQWTDPIGQWRLIPGAKTTEQRLADVERYCRMSRHSMTVPIAEMAEEILALIEGGTS